ncbi:uncharacterized protein LOC105194219 isoform X1 [Solenopsis invicta]|uniref:uncharacterized protein LOC105194219 isoform X1 n=1 Tax=Solenopsis invicta TaxID=13686 RepID=UPI00193D39AC|nr:uncharacterized protein LOC105194219 isoform X1 [Solenopsis invicta]
MISRYQVICALLLLGAVLLYQTMAQVDGYTPGVDYPIYNSVPFGLTFTCGGKLPGYYADPEARCQVWHWCLPNGRQFSFLCPNGTVFSQTTRVCDWWFKVPQLLLLIICKHLETHNYLELNFLSFN